MNNNKIYARQVAPEYQESPLALDNYNLEYTYWEDIELSGNSDFRDHISEEFETACRVCDSWDFSNAIEEVYAGESDVYNTLRDVLNDFLPREKLYTDTEENRLKRIIKAYRSRALSDNEYFLEILSLIKGTRYIRATIRGCVQRDWNYIYYPVDKYADEDIKIFECEYFNTGSEWIIHDEETPPESPDDISGYSIYCYGWNNEQIKQEIADAAGGDPANVVLYEFSKWQKVACYALDE